MKKPVAVKQNGSIQRADVTLTPEIACALVQKILSGETIYPPSCKLELLVEKPEGEETIILSTNTLARWVERGNVIPGSGNELKAVLNKARADYRTRKREELKDKLLGDAERELNRTLNIRTNIPVRDMFGKTIKNPDGSLVRKENANLLRIKLDAVKYVTERLDPDTYGKVEKTENKHLVFSLADLRRAKQERDNATMSEVQEA